MKERLTFGLVLSIVLAVFSILTFTDRTASRDKSAPPVPGDAKATFDAKCASCHGKDGRAKTMRGKLSHARNLSDAQWQANVSDERLFNSISNGRNQMPAFKKKLSEAEIDALVSYVRQLKR